MRQAGAASLLIGLAALLWTSCSSPTSEPVLADSRDGGGSDVSAVPDRVVFVDQTVSDSAADGLSPVDTPSIPDLHGPACEAGEGCFLDKCDENEDCLSGWCVEHLGEGVCSQVCQQECPAGWSCQQVAGTFPDVIYICVSGFANLCKPCNLNADCKSPGGTDDLCIDYGDEGSFCGGTCDPSETLRGPGCPWGFTCEEAVTVDGIETWQCLADTGTCPCTKKSAAQSLWTGCVEESEWGVCPGKRVCTESGLTDCDAPAPMEETCNGADDDCDAEVDEGTCDDDNDCTEDSCEGTEGCIHVPLSGIECKDGNPCTVADHCDAGACVGTPVLCEDGNPCTDDSCDGTGGCSFLANDIPCDDGNPCTVADQCSDGECTGVAVDCECTGDADCEPFEDGNLCNGTLFCNMTALPFQCQVEPDSVVACPAPGDGPDFICQKSWCDPATGVCSVVADHEGFACSDADSCTVGDACNAGECGGGVAMNCNDGNPCTDDSCEPAVGCVHTNSSEACSDGDVCTKGDQCVGGECVAGPPLACDDGNVCNGTESCSPEVGCVAGDALVCDDGNPCNGAEVCDPNDGCLAGPLLPCSDGNPCTDDACDPGEGCTHTPNESECSDGNACTVGDHCAQGDCVHGEVLSCDDGDPCTNDGCDPVLGCTHKLNTAPCDDGDLCTVGDHCHIGECIGSGSLPCNDGNACTADGCSPLVGCQFQALPDGTPCETPPGSTCLAGICLPCLPQCAGKECGDNGCGGDCGPCDGANHEVCEMTTCVCDGASGYHLGADGETCTDDPCDPNPCDPGNHEVCQVGECLCDAFAGYHLSGDGATCTTDPCDPDPCNPEENEVCEEGVCNQYTQVSGIVPPQAVWGPAESPYLVKGPLLVEEGETLTVEPGVTVVFEPGTYVKVEGSLVAVGDCEDAPIVFTTKKKPPVPKSWAGIQVRPTGGTVFGEGYEYLSGTRFECVRIEYADTGLYVYDAGLLVHRCTFFENEEAIEIRGTYKFKLSDSLLEANEKGLYSVHSGSGDGVNPITETLVQGNTFRDNVTGISLTVNQRHFAGLEILDNAFFGHTGGSVVFGGGGYGPYVHSARIAGNWVSGSSGGGIRTGNFYSTGTNGPVKGSATLPVPEYPVVVENNLVEASPGNPLHISSGSVKTRVAGNTVAGCEGGGNSVVLGGSSYGWLVEYNTIVSAHGGLQLSSGGSGHTLTRNTVTRATANYPALQYYGGSSLTVVDNNLMPSGGLAVKSQSTSPLQMNDNWWGTTDPAAIAQLIFDYYDDFELGKVTFDPPLAAPDTSAPISPPREVLKAAAPGGVLVSWAANPEADAAGYRVHRGSRTAFSFEQTEDAGEALSYLLVGAGLDDDIAVSAYDGEADGQDDWFEGHESWFTYAATAE